MKKQKIMKKFSTASVPWRRSGGADKDNGINPLCSILYERADNCNRHMDTTDVYGITLLLAGVSDGQYQEQNEEENENEKETPTSETSSGECGLTAMAHSRNLNFILVHHLNKKHTLFPLVLPLALL
jgi:hypothetical protein